MNPKTSLAIAVVAVALGAVALVIGLSAKSDSSSDAEVSQKVKDEVAAQSTQESGALQSEATSATANEKANAKSIGLTGDQLKKDNDAQTAKITALEQQNSTLAGQVKQAQTDIAKLESQLTTLKLKTGK